MVVTLGQQYNVGEKHTVILYTNINHHVGTPNIDNREHYQSRCTIHLDTSFILQYSIDAVSLSEAS